jgi:hypothetical protein
VPFSIGAYHPSTPVPSLAETNVNFLGLSGIPYIPYDSAHSLPVRNTSFPLNPEYVVHLEMPVLLHGAHRDVLMTVSRTCFGEEVSMVLDAAGHLSLLVMV